MANQTTTVSFVLVPANAVSANLMDAVDGDVSQVLAKAMAPSADRYGYLGRLFALPDVVAEGVVDAESTPVATELVDLTTQGLTTPAGHMRLIRWRHWVQTDNDRFYVEYERGLLGGTTPVLLGTRRVTHAHGVIAGTTVAYGEGQAQATYASADTATAVAGSTSAGWSLGNTSTNTTTLTHPIARATPKYYWVNASPDVATNTEQVNASIFGATSTTASIFTAAVTDGAADGFDDVGIITAGGFILPPGDADLVMNSNNVELQITGIASDETRHRVEVFIGRAVQVAFQGGA